MADILNSIDSPGDPNQVPYELPPLPQSQIEQMVAKYIAQRSGYLQAVDTYGSPLYIIEKETLRHHAQRFTDAFSDALGKKPKIFYAVKSNNCPEVAKIFLDHGLGLDVSSGAELEMALALNAQSIIFSGPGKTAAELDLAVNNSRRVTILIDSFNELQRLAQCLTDQPLTIKAGVRLTVDPNGAWRKFGIAPEALVDFMEQAAKIPNLSLEGIHFHTSWNLDPKRQVDFIGKLGAIIKQLPEKHRAKIKFVDIGGGYWPEQGEWLQAQGTQAGMLRNIIKPGSADRLQRFYQQGTPIGVYASDIAKAIKEHLFCAGDYDIYMEPGRWLIHAGVHILMKVIDCKYSDLIITDAGTNAVGWERFETDFFPVINLTAPALTEIPCEIQGCLCTPRDIWGYSVWGARIKNNDILMVPCQGAYTFSLKQNFIKPLPEVIVT